MSPFEKYLPKFYCYYVINFNDRDKMYEFFHALGNMIDLTQIDMSNLILENSYHDDGYKENPYIELRYKHRMTLDHRLVTAVNWLFSPFENRMIEYKKLLRKYSKYIKGSFIDIARFMNPAEEARSIDLSIHGKAFQTIRTLNIEIGMDHYLD